MNVPPVGPGSPNLGAPLPTGGIQPTPAGGAPTLPRLAAVQTDQIASLLQLLATPEISDLMLDIERSLPAQDPGVREQLIQSASSAVAAGNIAEALDTIQQLVTMNPQHAATIADHPALQTIRPDVANLVNALTAEAGTRAVQNIAMADQAITAIGVRKLPGSEIDLPAVLSLANHFFESGRMPDYLIAAELAQVVTTHYGWAPAQIELPLQQRADEENDNSTRVLPSDWTVRGLSAASALLKDLWGRAPLLVLLLAWLALGLIGGTYVVILRKLDPDAIDPSNVALGFTLWGLGFLALAGFGFYMRIRNIRF